MNLEYIDGGAVKVSDRPRTQDCTEEQLGYDVAVVDRRVGSDGTLESVTLLETWGKGRRKRAHQRELHEENRERPPENGGITYQHRGSTLIKGTPHLIYENGSEGYWWSESVAWCDEDHEPK